MSKSQGPFFHREAEPENSVLYIVGTPIGNLNDISFRAINILKKVSIIACEDTRTTKKLLNHFDIKNKLISLNQHNIEKKKEFLISELKNNCSIAIVSDAGMPLISDPGESLVKEIKKNNLDVICIPGPCAGLMGLVCSGFSCSNFVFFGFLPRTKKYRNKILENIFLSKDPSIVYESPKRILKLLIDLKNICGEKRGISISRELTKKYEQHIGNNIEDALNYFNVYEPKGEFTIIIEGNKKSEILKDDYLDIIKEDLINLMGAGLSHSAAVNYLYKKNNIPKNKIYNLVLNK